MTDAEKEPGKFVATLQEVIRTLEKPAWALGVGVGSLLAAGALVSTNNVAVGAGWPFMVSVILGVVGTFVGIYGLYKEHSIKSQAIGYLDRLTGEEANVLWSAYVGRTRTVIWKTSLATMSLVRRGLLKEIATHPSIQHRTETFGGGKREVVTHGETCQFEVPDFIWDKLKGMADALLRIASDGDEQEADRMQQEAANENQGRF